MVYLLWCTLEKIYTALILVLSQFPRFSLYYIFTIVISVYYWCFLGMPFSVTGYLVCWGMLSCLLSMNAEVNGWRLGSYWLGFFICPL